MLINSSEQRVQRTVSSLLLKYQIQDQDRDEIALDVIEFIALRLPELLDSHVFTMALYVRKQLGLLASGCAAEPEVRARLTCVALSTRQGLCAFLRSVDLDRDFSGETD